MRKIIYFLFMAMSLLSFGTPSQTNAQGNEAQVQQDNAKQDNSYFSDVMSNASDETLVATHYSHSSHSSHRSHQSGRY